VVYKFVLTKAARTLDTKSSVLGLQSHWDSTYADKLANFREHGNDREIWSETSSGSLTNVL
jgi:hypothetical protein